MKLACVVHRFGADIAGGSEAHCRHIAERLAEHHDVTVLTTTARDHVTWKNAFPPGDSMLGRVRVRRFAVARQRDLQRFREVSEIAFARNASDVQQDDYFRENGPDSPALIECLRASGHEFDLVLFWAFRYAEVYFGLPQVAARSVLVPTAEDDPVVHMPAAARLFALPAGYIFLTPEEQDLVALQLDAPLPPACIIGSGLEPAPPPSSVDLSPLGIRRPFLLYLGRVDPNKGCGLLLQHFARLTSELTDPPQLVLAGPENMPVPDLPHLKRLGFVDEGLRDALLAQAMAMVVPSRYESLSLALLEAWNHGLPAVVNGDCAVLKGQVRRANAGVFFHRYDEFAHAVAVLQRDPELARQLGQQGLDYVNAHYRWPTVMAVVEDLLGRVRAARS